MYESNIIYVQRKLYNNNFYLTFNNYINTILRIQQSPIKLGLSTGDKYLWLVMA